MSKSEVFTPEEEKKENPTEELRRRINSPYIGDITVKMQMDDRVNLPTLPEESVIHAVREYAGVIGPLIDQYGHPGRIPSGFTDDAKRKLRYSATDLDDIRDIYHKEVSITVENQSKKPSSFTDWTIHIISSNTKEAKEKLDS